MKILRKLHRYIGIFFAPTFLMLAVSGLYQILDWHRPKKVMQASGFSLPASSRASDVLFWLVTPPKRLVDVVTLGWSSMFVQLHMRPAGGSIWDVYSGRPSREMIASIQCSEILNPIPEEKKPEFKNCLDQKKVEQTDPPKSPSVPGSKGFQIFLLCACYALAWSSISGLIMGFRMAKSKWKPCAVLVFGIFVPYLLLFIQ